LKALAWIKANAAALSWMAGVWTGFIYLVVAEPSAWLADQTGLHGWRPMFALTLGALFVLISVVWALVAFKVEAPKQESSA